MSVLLKEFIEKVDVERLAEEFAKFVPEKCLKIKLCESREDVKKTSG
jgi:hypothetical protein